MKNYAIILAAGLGTRMKSEKPKCAFELLEKPMIEYLVDAVNKTSITDVITVVGHKREVIQEILGNRSTYAIQNEQLGTGHAVKCALDFVKGDGFTVILLGDAPLIDEEIINNIIKQHQTNKNDLTIGTFILEDPTGYGRIYKENGKVLEIVEQKEATKEQLLIKEVNSGLLCIDNKWLISAVNEIKNDNTKGEYYLTDLVKILSNQNKKIETYTIDDVYKLMGINDLYTLSIVEQYLREDINRKHMLNGVNIINPQTVTISVDTVIEQGTVIYPSTVLLGKNKISKNCIIGPNTEIKNSTLGCGVTVEHSVLRDSNVLDNTTVGPFAHIRLNATIGSNNRVGNFVEVKKSTTGDKTKISHLTYIGDTECGSNVNFGCGTVVVNYDGKNKHKTVIGDNVFIGCNTNLIAPIKVENDSFIAAGSTVTTKVEQGDFVIARSKQVTKKNYAKKFK